MEKKEAIQDFINQKKIAVVGASRKKSKFGQIVCKELKEKGYQLFPINPNAEEILGMSCYPDLFAIPDAIDGVVLVIPPLETERVVREIVRIGIPRVWMQQGAESSVAIDLCKQNNISVVHGECILMFAQPLGFFHNFHRLIWKIIGKYPN
jgi:predicted CoA-binding protein